MHKLLHVLLLILIKLCFTHNDQADCMKYTNEIA